MSDLAKQLTQLFGSIRKRTTFRMILGDGKGNLIVYDPAGNAIPGYYWARPQASDETSASIRQIRVRKTAAQYGLMVICGYGIDGEIEAIEEDPVTAIAFTGGRAGNVPNHNTTHQLQSHDPVFISGEQILPGLPHPTNPPSLSVYVRPFHYVYGGVNSLWAGGGVNLTSYLPTGSNQHRLVIVSFNPSTGAMAVHAGAAIIPLVPGSETMVFGNTDIQAIPITAGNWRMCAVRLYVGQTQILWRDWVTDLRIPFTGIDAALSGVDNSARYLAWRS